MTQDGAISNEQREFYRVFSQHLREHEGEFLVEDIERLLLEAKKETPDLIDEEFFKMGEAILNRYRNKNEEGISFMLLLRPTYDSFMVRPFMSQKYVAQKVRRGVHKLLKQCQVTEPHCHLPIKKVS